MESLAAGMTTPPTPPVPVTIRRPDARICSKMFLVYCTPTVVFDVTTGDRRNDPVDDRFAE